MSSSDQKHEAITQSEPASEPQFEVAADVNAIESNGHSHGVTATAGTRQAVRDFLAGRSEEAPAELPDDYSIREQVLLELLAALAISESEDDAGVADDQNLELEQERARQLFIDYGFLDQSIHDLRAEDSATRVEAAHRLGLVGSQRGTAPLIAALFDDAQEVRDAATAALKEIGDPAVSMASGPINSDATSNPVSVKPTETEVPGVPEEAIAVPEIAAEATGDVLALEESEVVQDSEAIKARIEALESELVQAVLSRSEIEREVRSRIAQETSIRLEFAARHLEAEEAIKRAAATAASQRQEAEARLVAEQLDRTRVETEAQAIAKQEAKLRLESFNLRTLVHKRDREQAEVQAAELAATHATELAAAELSFREATEQHAVELGKLRSEEELLRTAAAEAVLRRGEVEAGRRRSELDNQQLRDEQASLAVVEVACREEGERVRAAEAKLRQDQAELVRRAEELRQFAETATVRRHELDAAQHRAEVEERELFDLEARTRSAEDDRRQAQAERMRLESEIRQRAQTEQHLLEEARARAVEQEDSLAESGRLRAEEHQRRRAELEIMRERLEADVQRRTEQENELIARIESLRTDEAELRKRIEDLETRRSTAERSSGIVTEQVQRMEAEAHLRATEEERALAKLEEVRRNVAHEAQARAEQEERIKREIETIRGLEDEHRKRLELEIQRRADAEMRLQHEKDRLRTAEAARVKADAHVELLAKPGRLSVDEEIAEWHDDPAENLRRMEPVAAPAALFTAEVPITDASPAAPYDLTSKTLETVLANLNSANSAERAAAFAEVPKLELPNAFDLIVKGFDDPAAEVRAMAARALREIEPARPVDPFTRALEEASPERRRNIGLSIASSGLAAQALNDLDADSREDTYNALCLLFVMAKSGEVKPLIEAIETHPDVEVRRAAIKLLNLSGQSDLAEAAAKRRLGLGRTNGA